MKTYGGVEMLHLFSTSALDEGAPATFPQGKILPFPLDRRVGEPHRGSGGGGDEKNAYPWRESNSGRPAHDQSLHRLRYQAFYSLHLSHKF
jgi:hypothetical protein